MLVVDKEKSFDKNLKGDFNLRKGLIERNKEEDLEYIYTGLQIIKSDVFLKTTDRIFSINKIWDKLIEKQELHALESAINFQHVSTLDIYKKLNIK